MLEIEVLTYLKSRFIHLDVSDVTGNPSKLIDFLMKNGAMNEFMPVIKSLMQSNQNTRSSQQLLSASTIRSSIGQHSTPKAAHSESLQLDDDQPIDLSMKTSRDRDEFDVVRRSEYIHLSSHQRKRKSIAPKKVVMTSEDDESDVSAQTPSPFQQTPTMRQFLPAVDCHPMLMSWRGASIYENLPSSCIDEFNKILKSSFDLKVKVLSRLNDESPVRYDYNMNKSLVRTDYLVSKAIADERIKNNIASRRSRHRKKFKNNVRHNAVNFDREESLGIDVQIENMRRLAMNLEQKILDGGESTIDMIMNLRLECGLI